MFSEVTQPTHLFVRSDWDLALEDTQAGRISFGELASDRRRCGGFDAITVIEDARNLGDWPRSALKITRSSSLETSGIGCLVPQRIRILQS